ncbi:hypothetical protein GCM10011613_26160 [Cellvibrio zantedeschiae]|uniref:CSD domain-containing protein n=1 Tax=Cellvibrio zantedeschiae TaxID=1237077 RepID=A0ABQ3B5J2_9GAMM|nr:DUF1294 domain-containing protein [Cellvibrio zantedeschiae]GGY79933.1 hypothetical protein GCM10011613_26160 [Cellvibrio zantedeschiae]
MDKELSGTIKQWNDQKGFGFIAADSPSDVFFHISALRGDRRPQIGDEIFYVPTKDEKGRLIASRIRYVDIKSNMNKSSKSNAIGNSGNQRNVVFKNIKIKVFIFALLLAPVVIGIAAVWIHKNFPWAAYLYFSMSLFSFYLYWNDKRHAEIDARRISEARLHFFELVGGWPGALIAQQVFRHKTRKLSYQFIFWLIVILHELFWLDQVLVAGKVFGAIS